MQQPFAAGPYGNAGNFPQFGQEVYSGYPTMPYTGHNGQGRGVPMPSPHMIRPDGEMHATEVEGGHNGSVLGHPLPAPVPAAATSGFFSTLMRTGTVMFAPTTSGIGMMGSAPTSYTCGLKWHSVGDARPGGGRELTNHQLADALQFKTRFLQEELDGWGLTDLREDDFIASGKCFFRPVPGMTCCMCGSTCMRVTTRESDRLEC